VLRPPKNLPVRPTTDLAKESLFNILNNRIDFEGLQVIDLFSGTGNITLEFASRGAGSVIAVDIHNGCIRYLMKMALELGFQCIQPVRADVFRFLERQAVKTDLIFADPPYDLPEIEKIPVLVFRRQLINPDGWLIIEHPGTIDFSEHARFLETRKYGNVHFSFFRNA